ncbi:MAG: EAL domain-containing protein [Thiotrichales bacterium]|nr:EAL domain-containing protein [Thiotrichales bacterium]
MAESTSLDKNDLIFDGLLKTMPVIVFVLDQSGTFLFSKGAGLKPLGLKDDQVVGLHYLDIYAEHPEIIKQIKTALAEGFLNAETELNGLHYRLFYRPLRDGQVVGIALDQTEFENLKKQSDYFITELLTAYEVSNEGMWSLHLKQGIVEHNRRWREIFGYSEDEPSNLMEHFANRVHPDDIQRVLSKVESAMESGETFNHEYRLNTPYGLRYVQDRGKVVSRDKDGNPERMTGSLSDITQDVLNQKKLEQLAFQDELTGLPNKVSSENFWKQQPKLENALPVGFAILDIDNFKLVNDVLGHKVGDVLIQNVANLIYSQLTDKSQFFRLGGDEFLIISQNITQEKCLSNLKDLLASVKKVAFHKDVNVKNTFSCGVAFYPDDGHHYDDLFRRAENALYQAKNNGKDQLVRFDMAMELAVEQRYNMLVKLQKALVRKQLFFHYQPQISLIDGRCVGAEILLRWLDDDGKLIPPNVFIPIAEQSQQIIPMTYWIIEEAFLIKQKWHNQGHFNIELAINLPAQFLSEPNLVSYLEQKAQKFNLENSEITLEITESQLMQNHTVDHFGVLRELRLKGFGLAVDDFGTGYSNLANLANCSFSKLKIDKKFIDGLSAPFHNSLQVVEGSAIVKAMLGMAKSLNLEVIAEGVETQEQAEWLKHNGCGQIQGYYFSKPLPEEDFLSFLALHG